MRPKGQRIGKNATKTAGKFFRIYLAVNNTTKFMLSVSDVANSLSCHHLLMLDRAQAVGEIKRPSSWHADSSDEAEIARRGKPARRDSTNRGPAIDDSDEDAA